MSTLGVFTFLLLLTLLLWITLTVHSQGIQAKNKEFNSKVYDGVLFNTSGSEEDDPTEGYIGRRHLSMLDSDVWSHTHRMYLIGENSISFPWYIPKDFPNRALDPENKDKMIRFIKSKQGALDWTEL